MLDVWLGTEEVDLVRISVDAMLGGTELLTVLSLRLGRDEEDLVGSSNGVTLSSDPNL
jgi:hypothetical protein